MGTTVSLGNHFESFVQQMLQSGRYNNASEIVRDGLRMIEERERRVATLDAILTRSRADVKAGRMTPAEQVFDNLEAEINALPGSDTE
jgi:antitoxin ParD1/3/4